MSGKADFALARNIGFQNAPLVMQDYVSMVLASDDAEEKRRYLELMHKMQEKEAIGDGVMFEFRIDMSGMITGTIETQPADVIEADDQRPAPLPAPDAADDGVIDLADLLAVNDPAPAQAPSE